MSAAPPADQDNLIASLSDLTGLAPAEVMEPCRSLGILLTHHQQAEQFLTAGNWDLQAAAALYFDEAAPTDPTEHSEMADDEPQNPTPNVPPQQQQQPGGGRTLAGDYVPPPPASSSSRQPARRQPQRGLRTLGDLQSAGASGHGHDDGDHDDDSDYQDDENQDFFAGGEKSGLAVQNPNNQSNPRDQINNILRRARQ
jgi:UBX domain-containing protein 1